MSKQNEYSDEHINAYIDSELDSDERARLLFDEQEDASLAKRVNEVRMLKEKIQLAYSGSYDENTNKTPFSCTAFVSRHRSLVAGWLIFTAISATLTYNMGTNDNLVLAKQLIANTQPISASSISDAIGVHKRVIILLSQYNPEYFSKTIDHIEAVLRQHSNDKSFNVEIVANGQGLKALDMETSIHAERIAQLSKQFSNLKVVACGRSLAKLAAEGDPIQLMRSIMITPSAAQQIAKRISNNWFYLKI